VDDDRVVTGGRPLRAAGKQLLCVRRIRARQRETFGVVLALLLRGTDQDEELTDSLKDKPKAGRGADKRGRLVAAARHTLHEQGVERTTLADIASAAEVPLGNVYYYFKTKDDLVAAVIEAYDNDYAMLDAILKKHRTPKARLKALIRVWTTAKERLARFGCPIGSLCSELGKRDDDLTRKSADVFEKLIAAAEEQFRQLGRRDARDLAIALVASYEGIVLIASAMRDPELIAREARRLERWIDSIT
jgi:TetR/AcrR family transcriptional regulator, transcriptional repressor for nem operon